MSDETWNTIRESIERVQNHTARRVDIELAEVKVSAYRAGETVRCDLIPLRKGAE